MTTPLAVAPVTALKNMPHAVSMLGAAPPGNGGVGMEIKAFVPSVPAPFKPGAAQVRWNKKKFVN